ncbi:MAG: hypothetical protein LUQ67_03485, partial [Methanomicrobiales archaeon]|nr:hypothetical protein [Methanomicrobiales archaeon]
MAGCSARGALLILLSLILLVQAAPGMEVAIGPDRILAENPLSLNLTNVTDGTVLNLTLTAVYSPPPDVTWLNVTGWNYPFALQGGRVRVNGRNVNQLALLIRVGNTFMTQRGSGAGNITLEIPLDILPMTVYDFRIEFEPHTAAAPVDFTLFQQGAKHGMEVDAFLTPSLLGMEQGNVTLQVFANGTLRERKEIQVLAEMPPAP